MTRPHIEFLQSQRLPWSPGDPFAVKPLSRDDETGAATELLRVPAGWEAPGTHHLDADEELFVLSGELTIGEHRYGPHHYAFLPKGYPRRDCRSGEGAVLLSMVDHAPTSHEGEAPAGLYDPARAIPHLDPFTMAWDQSGQDPGIHDLQAARKILRMDPDGKRRSFLLAGMPHGLHPARAKRQEWHAYCEEMFLISGDLACHCGLMRPGAYFWRPPEKVHGLEASLTGFVAFLRIPGSNHNVNNWVEEGAVSLTPPYRPILPPALEPLRGDAPADPITY